MKVTILQQELQSIATKKQTTMTTFFPVLWKMAKSVATNHYQTKIGFDYRQMNHNLHSVAVGASLWDFFAQRTL